MRKTMIALALGVGLAGIARVHGEEAPPTTTTTVPAPLTQTTTVEGSVPDLGGRWLLLATVALGESAKRTLTSVFDIGHTEGKVEIRERHVILPEAQNAALKRANDELGGVWAPTPADLEAIGSAWNTLEPELRGIVKIENQLTGRDAYDDDLKKDESTKDALWVFRQSYNFESGGSRPVNQANLIAPQKVEDGVYSGKFIAVAVAAAPFPVPITFKGTFRMVPLSREPRSWWTRIGDFFAGCGKR
jgi:hypothetical protein